MLTASTCWFRALAVALAALVTLPASAQMGFGLFNGRNHPEIDWQVARTEHFEIVYPAHLAGIEAEAAPIAEQSLAALAQNFAPSDSTLVTFDDPIRIYLSDEDEIANGIAFNVGSSGFTTIWVHVNEFADIWTGDVKWLRKVLAHEIAHLVHYRAVRTNLGLLAAFFADPFPSFWTEGLAQYQTERWDAQRGDRWLRTATFEDRLSYTDGTSPKNGRLRYAVGNSQVRYLAETYGDSTISKILAWRDGFLGLEVNDFQAAFREVVGKPYRAFYEEWRKHVNVYYNTQAGQMERLDSLATEPFAFPGQVVYDVAFSPDTTQVAGLVLTSLARPVRRLFVMNHIGADSTAKRDLRVLAEGAVQAPIAWSPDGSQIAYARSRRGRYGSLVDDLYLVNVATGDARRLTDNRRASSPTFAPDGRIAFVGVEGTTANVFVLDPEAGTERQLTAFEGDVQITSARWSPGGSQIAIALFDADRRRSLALVDAPTGTVSAVASGEGVAPFEKDDRWPVWNAAGDSLAFTSLRDRAPNVFVARTASEPAGPPPLGLVPSLDGGLVPFVSPPDSPEDRVTFLYDGATVHDWLPPDSLHPAGRLVLVASETKRRDRVFVVDAARRPTVEADTVVVPDAYAAWTRQRPPVEIPYDIEADASLIRERYGYNSWKHITHAITLPFVYADPAEDNELFTADDDWGVFANTLWLEPLGKHQLLALAGVSVTRPVDKSFLLLSYANRQLAPTLTLNLYRFPSPSSFYGSSVLVEDLIGGDLGAEWALDLLDRPFTVTLAGARLRYAYAEPLALDRFENLEATGLDLPEAGTRFDVQVGAAYKFQRPYRWNVISPIDGTGLRARAAVGIPALGGEAFLRPDVLGYWVSPEVGFGRVFTKGRATAVFGEQLAQDYVGLARYDDVDVQLPFVGALTLDDAERVRGHRSYAVGTRSLFGSLEYRFPMLFDLRTSLLGAVRLGRVAPALFADGGLVWTGADLGGAVRRLGVGAEVKNVVSLGGFEVLHAVGVGVPAGRLDEVWDGSILWDDVDLYYRIQGAIPF